MIKKNRTSLFLTPITIKALRIVHAHEGLTNSAIIETALKEHLLKYKEILNNNGVNLWEEEIKEEEIKTEETNL